MSVAREDITNQLLLVDEHCIQIDGNRVYFFISESYLHGPKRCGIERSSGYLILIGILDVGTSAAADS